MAIGSPCSRGRVLKGVTSKGSESLKGTDSGATVEERDSLKVTTVELDLTDDTKLKSSKDLLTLPFFDDGSNGALPLSAFHFGAGGLVSATEAGKEVSRTWGHA